MHHTDGLNLDFGGVCGGQELFELGALSGAVDGPKGGGYADAIGAMHEGARNLAHQAKIREAQEYLRQQNAQKQQQRLGLAHPPQLQYQPQPPPPPYLREQNAQKQQQRFGLPHPPQPQYQFQPPPPPPPPPPAPAPAPLQGVSSPKKRGFAEMARGDSLDAAPGAKGVARVKQRECVGICGGTHIHMHARTRTL